jgi:hypothetical protein
LTNDSSQELCRIIYEWLLLMIWRIKIMHFFVFFLFLRRIVVIGVWHVLTHSTNKTTTNFKCWVNEPEINDINNKLDSSFALFSLFYFLCFVWCLQSSFTYYFFRRFVSFLFFQQQKIKIKWNKNTTQHISSSVVFGFLRDFSK